jgi:hypothetical protein
MDLNERMLNMNIADQNSTAHHNDNQWDWSLIIFFGPKNFQNNFQVIQKIFLRKWSPFANAWLKK